MNIIIDRLYLGSLKGAGNTKRLKETGITHILTCGRDFAPRDTSSFKWKRLIIDDNPNDKITPFLDEAVDFIKEAMDQKDGKILVHCFAGMSRSACCVIAYLIRELHYDSYFAALHFVKRKRSIVSPNSGFGKEMIEYDKKYQELD
mmetsp:Transcript_22114/g.15792  ORF Transcript_22114/g.15792 Transcript_22114/m.15792 type:complete len:146 (+) Transcript_22114:58-495(+)